MRAKNTPRTKGPYFMNLKAEAFKLSLRLIKLSSYSLLFIYMYDKND